MSNTLDMTWETGEDILINKKAIDLQGNILDNILDRRVSKHGIPLYWATLVYFKKSKMVKSFFELIDYVREEYNFFQFLYGFKEGFYRNDFSFSIASHIFSGYIKNGLMSFPVDYILTSYQKDGIAEVINSNEIIFLSNNVKEPWKDTIVNIKDRDVHIMNKRELLRVSDKIIELCLEKL